MEVVFFWKKKHYTTRIGKTILCKLWKIDINMIKEMQNTQQILNFENLVGGTTKLQEPIQATIHY